MCASLLSLVLLVSPSPNTTPKPLENLLQRLPCQQNASANHTTAPWRHVCLSSSVFCPRSFFTEEERASYLKSNEQLQSPLTLYFNLKEIRIKAIPEATVISVTSQTWQIPSSVSLQSHLKVQHSLSCFVKVSRHQPLKKVSVLERQPMPAVNVAHHSFSFLFCGKVFKTKEIMGLLKKNPLHIGIMLIIQGFAELNRFC